MINAEQVDSVQFQFQSDVNCSEPENGSVREITLTQKAKFEVFIFKAFSILSKAADNKYSCQKKRNNISLLVQQGCS